ncbi:MAG TPA: biotin transporter BioY [Bacillales bacterium]|nr:biotin transporter BioY [Bacillales bacterium]
MKVIHMVYVALFTAIMAVLGVVPAIYLAFTPVPIVLQNMGVMLSGSMLGARLGALSQLLFLALVAAGAPVLTGGRGGLAVFFGVSGGYLIAYPIAAFVVGLLLARMQKPTYWRFLAANILGGVLVVYAIGIPYQAFMMDISLWHAIVISSVYIPGDLLKAVVASYLALRVRKHMSIHDKAGPMKQAG